MPRRSRGDDTSHRSHTTLDPFGIYGTRTEQRLLSARRRRILQQSLSFAAVAAVVFVALMLVRLPHVPTLKGVRVGLTQPPGASPSLATDSRGAALLIPTEGGDLQRFDPATGAMTTMLDTAFPLRATPLVFRNVAFVPCEDGVLYAVDWQTNRLLWHHTTASPLGARPALAEVTLAAVPPLVGYVKRNLVIIGNDGGSVRALEAGNGRVVWQHLARMPVGGGIVVAPGEGKEPPRALVPLVEGAGGRGGLLCLDARNGAVLWKFPGELKTRSPQLAPPALDAAGGRVFYGDDTGAVTCVRLKNGTKIWKTYARHQDPKSKESVLFRGEPLFQRDAFGERVILGGNDGLVRCYDARNGNLLWKHDMGHAVRCRPLSVDTGRRPAVLIGSDGSEMWELDAVDGSIMQRLRTRDAAPFTAVAWNHALYTITSNGNLEKFKF